jgi:hypothetical protein
VDAEGAPIDLAGHAQLGADDPLAVLQPVPDKQGLRLVGGPGAEEWLGAGEGNDGPELPFRADMAEDWTAAPLLRLDLFRNPASGIASIASVIGMFCFLGTAYSTTIRLTVILGFTPLPAAPPPRRLSCGP